MTILGGQGPESCICILSGASTGPGTQQGLLLPLLTRRHSQWPHWLRGRPHPSSPGCPQRRLTWSGQFIPAWAQGWLMLSPSLLPGSAKSSPPCYWKGFQELEARFTQRVNHGRKGGGRGGRVSGSVPQRGAQQEKAGRSGQCSRDPTAGCAPGQPGAHRAGSRPLEHTFLSISVFTPFVPQPSWGPVSP